MPPTHVQSSPVKNEVPFLTNSNLDCGPVALAMTCAFFGLQAPLPRIQELVVAETSGATWTLGLAAAAAELGLSVRMYSKNFGVSAENFNLEYYREHASGLSEAQQKLATLASRCKSHGGVLEGRSLSLAELQRAVTQGSVPILLLDWSKVIDQPSYIGHFVPMVGHTNTEVLVHNPGPRDAAAFQPLRKEIFEIARTAPGTDEDVLIITGLRT